MEFFLIIAFTVIGSATLNAITTPSGTAEE